MPRHPGVLRSDKPTRCAVCERKFGLVRHYSWRTPLCSKGCVDRFTARRDGDRNWLGWLKLPIEPMPENRTRAS